MEQWAIVPARPSPASDADILPKLHSVGDLSPFDQLISAIHEGILSDGEVRPIPLMLGDGRMVDLLKLHLSVRERGGYDSVSESGSWAAVAQAVGLDSAVAASVKFVFVKYLGAVDRLIHVPVGRHHQAEVQDFVVISSQISNDPDDLKWLGTPIWLPMKEENRLALQGYYTGKGRPDSCGCKHSGSVGCIKFHVAEERLRVKFELGSAFSKWKFDNMGEEVALSWTVEEQEKFKDIVRSNRASLGKDFWGELHHSFPKKSSQSIVSYYFNVFIISRRAYQNQFDPHNIDSDDDESEVDDFACDNEYFCKNTECMDLGE
ncbi:AT-rich interactive domain-containing protein 2 [Acorus gramineus]|uniref:AT-rich interactive domain-containing protein 2 n=1 Tax=Acorus gramineus TaxID=55184 RepID=A0AAV9AQ13_ACOGR|nr:AT-rich interactive domain-containing protein 2 [Acorus gramineus]